MSTCLEFLTGEVMIRDAGNTQKFLDELDHNAGVTWERRRIGVIYFQYWGEVSSNWAQVLSNALNEYADTWDIEAKQELCDPVRIWKSKSGKGEVRGTQLTYYPGFEEDFIQQLPDEVVNAIKAKGGKKNA